MNFYYPTVGKLHHCWQNLQQLIYNIFCPFVTSGSLLVLPMFVWTHGAQRSLQQLPTAANGYSRVYPAQMCRHIKHNTVYWQCHTAQIRFQAICSCDQQNLYTLVVWNNPIAYKAVYPPNRTSSDLLWVINFSSDSARAESHRAAEMCNSLRADLQKIGQRRAREAVLLTPSS